MHLGRSCSGAKSVYAGGEGRFGMETQPVVILLLVIALLNLCAAGFQVPKA
jgi:hypothetical protein